MQNIHGKKLQKVLHSGKINIERALRCTFPVCGVLVSPEKGTNI